MENTHLGKSSPYIDTYAPDLLVPIARAPIRQTLGIRTARMNGVDIWNHWEVSYLNATGKPEICCLSISYDALSSAIVESKSLKLYFNSFNQSVVESQAELIKIVSEDLRKILDSDVSVSVLDETCLRTDWIEPYDCIDEIAGEFTVYQPDADLLSTSSDVVSERLCSHLFKTNCMVTGQPDWASVFIDYRGPKLDRLSLLQYLVSFRDHQAFHEPCCEMIFSDLLQYCHCEELSVYCRYTRRGGIDINPYRSTQDDRPDNLRILRQ